VRLIILRGNGSLRETIQLHGEKLTRAQEARILDFVEQASNLTVIQISTREPTPEELRLMKI